MVQERNIAALTDIIIENQNKSEETSIVIGTHGTALSTILNYYDRDYNCDSFLRIIDWMPYIIELDFDGENLVRKQEHFHIEKEFKDPINYGYVDGIMAPDGEEQDAYILGINVPVDAFRGKIIAVVHRNDDVEDKWVVCPDNMTYSEEEIRKQIDFQEKYFDSYIRME